MNKNINYNFHINLNWVFLSILIFIIEGFSFSNSDDFKTLYLVRHAKSSFADSTLTDFDRPLNERGFSNAPEMGKRLHKLSVAPDIIISSPSKRTTQTIEFICKEIKFDINNVVWDSTIYHCSDKAMLDAIMNIRDEFKSAMIVGHNYTITNLANKFQSDTIIEEVPTCGVVAIQFEIAHWKDVKNKKGKLLFFEYPKKVN